MSIKKQYSYNLNKMNILLSCRKFFGPQPYYAKTESGSRMRYRIWLDRVSCRGVEHNIGACLRTLINRWSQVRCSRIRLAGVMCDPGIETLVKTPPLDNATKHVDVSYSIAC